MIDYMHLGGSSLMIWADTTTEFRTELVIFHDSVTANLYLERILQPVDLPVVQNNGPIHYNARPHRARILNEFVLRNNYFIK